MSRTAQHQVSASRVGRIVGAVGVAAALIPAFARQASQPPTGIPIRVPNDVAELGSAAYFEPVHPVPSNSSGTPPEIRHKPGRTRAWAAYTAGPLSGHDVITDLMHTWRYYEDGITRFFDGGGLEAGELNWMPFNLGLLEAPLPGDFMPVGDTIADGSAPLLPATEKFKPLSWNGISRATLHESVDLVTGVPLVETNDLVLPFGGAEFRLNRTRSANRQNTGKTFRNEIGVSSADTRWWDWVGQGWMMSENPILLIDSRVADVVGDGAPRTWFWLDAHHSIPFDWVSDSEVGTNPNGLKEAFGGYDAAPRYRATLRALRGGTVKVPSTASSNPEAPRRIGAFGGAPHPSAHMAGNWMPGYYPDTFEVSLYDGALTYVFDPIYEDVPTWPFIWPNQDEIDLHRQPPNENASIYPLIKYSSLHGRPLLPGSLVNEQGSPPANPSDTRVYATQNQHPWLPTALNASDVVGRSGSGLGMPYYGLLREIRDRQGNRAVMEYATVLEWPNLAGPPVQSTSQKGALSRVQLFPAGQSTPAWTLVYAYRLVPRARTAAAGPYSDITEQSSSTPPPLHEGEYEVTGLGWPGQHWHSMSAEARVAWSDPVLECVYVFDRDVETRGITLMRPPEESLWPAGSATARRWATDADDLLARFQAGNAGIEALYAKSAVPGPADIKNRSDWTFRVRYWYASTDLPNGYVADDTGTGIPENVAQTPGNVRYLQGVRSHPLLVRTQTQMRSGTELRTLQNLVYQYESYGPFHHTRWLHSVFDDAGMERIHRSIRETSPATLEQTIQDLASGKSGRSSINESEWSLGFKSTNDGQATTIVPASAYRDAARLWFGNAGPGGVWQDDGESLTLLGPGGDVLSGFAKPDLSQLATDGLIPEQPNEYCADSVAGTVAAFSAFDPALGKRRHYRVHRLIRAPGAIASAAPGLFDAGEWGGTAQWAKPMRSIFSNPYKWHAYASAGEYEWPTMQAPLHWLEDPTPGTNAAVSTKSPTTIEYDKHRWVTIIDEFPTWDSARSAGPTTVSGKGSFFAGQLSRRIIGLSPAGNVLWEKTFTLRGDRFDEGGDTGLNESYVYKTGKQLISEVCPTVDPETLPETVKSELFLVQKRSVGWAAAPLDGGPGPGPSSSPTSQVKAAGLIWNYEYRDETTRQLPAAPSESPDPDALPWGERIKPFAESIQFGNSSNASRRYTSQTFYDQNDPTVVLGTAQFTKPRAQPFQKGADGLTEALDDVDAIVSRSITKRYNDGEANAKTVTVSVSPPRTAQPGGALMADISMSITNASGNTVWTIAAFVPYPGEFVDPDAISLGSSPDARVRLTYHTFDNLGRPTKTIDDVESDVSLIPNGETDLVEGDDRTLLPAGIVRRAGPGGSPAANLTTTRDYNDEGLSDLVMPNGKRWARRIERERPNPDPAFNEGKPFDRVHTMYDLAAVGEPSEFTFSTTQPGSVVDWSRYTGKSPYIRNDADRSEIKMLRQAQVRYLSNVCFDQSGFTTNPDVELMGPSEFVYDSAGRSVAADAVEYDANGVATTYSAEILDNADRVSTFEWDGTFTRRTRNARGQIVRTFIGTTATRKSLAWDNDLPGSNPDPGASSSSNGSDTFDMLLRERVEFGTHWSNALQRVRQWSYLETPTDWSPEQRAPFGPAPADDPHGTVTETRFDWRMRPVRVDTFGPEGSNAERPLQSSRLTFLDHADRVVLEATYATGATPPADIDPSVAPGADLPSPSTDFYPSPPTPAAILSATPAPASLTETIYFPDGSVKERRTYRTPGPGYTFSGSAQFHAERSFYGYGGKQTFSQRPESPVQITTLDNFGRVMREATVMPRADGTSTLYDFELTRTEYRYDSDGNVVLTDRYERLRAPASSAELTAGAAALVAGTNTSVARTETWYNYSKRVIAVCEHGDEHAALGSATLVQSIDAALAGHTTNPNSSPRITGTFTTVPATVATQGASGPGRWTFHAYDDAGLKIATLAPDGKLTVFSYDKNGRLIKEVANATATNASDRTITEHAYWLGRLISTFTKRTDQAGTEQFQSVAYGAQIVAVRKRAINHDRSLKVLNQGTGAWVDPTPSVEVDDLEYISNSNQLVGAMMSVSPHKDNLELVGPAGGQTLQARALVPLIKSMLDFQYARPDFAYRYYADGLLAERVDKRGVAIRYYYDDQRRLSAQEVWHYERSVTPQHDVIPVGTWLPDLQPTDRNIWKITERSLRSDPNVAGSATDIPNAVPGYPGWMGIPNSATGFDHPVDRIGFISYTYDSRGNLERVTAGTSRAAVNAVPPAIVAETKYLYDDRSNLIKEIQSHGGSADLAGVPFIVYTRQYTAGFSNASSFSPGRDRLLSMTYPGHAGYSGPRTVTFDYGNATGLDALVDRASSYNMGTSRIAGFTYTGSGRRVATALGGTATTPWVRQTFDTDPNTHALEGLDAFGRVKDLHYRNTATNPATLWRGQYGYDTGGNRLYERLTQRPPSQATVGVLPGVGGDNTRSRRFFYDAMDRLKSAESGALNAENTVIGHSAAYPGLGAGALPAGLRRESWGLDKLGNWSVGLDPPPTTVTQLPSPGCGWPTIPWGQTDDTITVPWPGGGPTGGTTSAIGHSVERVDSAANVTSESAGGHLPSDFNVQAPWSEQWALNAVRWRMQRDAAGQETWTRHLTDANGNLVYDGAYFYQYDAWNRLIQVNDATGTHWVWFEGYDANGGQKLGTPRWKPPEGQFPATCPPGTIGWLIKHFNYDGVGRLYRTSSRLDPSLLAEGYAYAGGGVANRSERFFYDGTRRIQELITDPVVVNNGDGDVSTMQQEGQQTQGTAGGEGGNQLPGPSFTITYVRAMYIWGPGDSPTSGVDELLVQIDPRDTGAGAVSAFGGKPWWALSDAQGDVIALLHKASASTTAEVAAQWTYSPYGEVLTYEQFHPHPVLVFGHKSLVADRLDTQAVSWDTALGTISDTQRLIPGAKLIAYARNRTYSPSLGRWLQQDPNASGQGESSAMFLLGASPDRVSGRVELRERLRDGPSMFGYVGQNPITNSDPAGLFIGGLLMPGPADVLMIGVKGLRGGLEEMLGQYAANQEADLEWALDWSMPENIHSRMSNSWVSKSFEEGLYGGLREGLLDALDPTGGYLTKGPDEGDGDPAMAGIGGTVARGASKLIGVSRVTYKMLRREYNANRMKYWKAEILRDQKLAKSQQKYSQEQVKDVLVHGRAPKGKDGHPMEIHHHKGLYEGGSNSFGNLRFMTRTEHRGPGKFKDLHPGLFK